MDETTEKNEGKVEKRYEAVVRISEWIRYPPSPRSVIPSLNSQNATGLGRPMEAIVDKVETILGYTIVTVTYTHPDETSGFGGCYVQALLTKLS